MRRRMVMGRNSGDCWMADTDAGSGLYESASTIMSENYPARRETFAINCGPRMRWNQKCRRRASLHASRIMAAGGKPYRLSTGFSTAGNSNGNGRAAMAAVRAGMLGNALSGPHSYGLSSLNLAHSVHCR